jgi:hypothetical protein
MVKCGALHESVFHCEISNLPDSVSHELAIAQLEVRTPANSHRYTIRT